MSPIAKIKSLKIRPAAVIAALVVVALVAGGGAWWMGRRNFETTDNAFIQADTVAVAPQVDGYVTEVCLLYTSPSPRDS